MSFVLSSYRHQALVLLPKPVDCPGSLFPKLLQYGDFLCKTRRLLLAPTGREQLKNLSRLHPHLLFIPPSSTLSFLWVLVSL